MHPSRIARQSPWLLSLLLLGCSATGGPRFGGSSQTRTIAVVGEQPQPAASGEPGGKVVAESDVTEPRRNPRTRISGRVVDEMGEPIAGATVRLADGGSRGGKEIRGTSDRSGAFTLNGLRAGSSYVLIAEAEDEHGPLVGRIDARTAETGVEIGLAPESGKQGAGKRPGRTTRARPVSSKEAATGDEGDERSLRLNREDVALPADEAEGQSEADPGPGSDRAGRPRLSKPEPGVGWRNSKDATASRARDEDAHEETATSDRPGRRPGPASSRADRPDADDQDPLPPALEREPESQDDAPTTEAPASARTNRTKKVGLKPKPPAGESGEIALAPEVSNDPPADRTASDSPGRPPTVRTSPPNKDPDPARRCRRKSPRRPPSRRSLRPSGPGLRMPAVNASSSTVVAAKIPPAADPPSIVNASQTDAAPKNPALEPVFASSTPAPSDSPKDAYNPFAQVAQVHYPPDRIVDNPPLRGDDPTEPEPNRSPEPVRRKWGELAASDLADPVSAALVEPTRATTAGPPLRRKRAATEGRESALALCSYDAKQRKLTDFALPDLEGKPVRFQDLDADFVLLDFWGTWCAPCLDAIPHLVALQKKYGPSRLKVVGIACEEVSTDQRKAKVDEVARKFGINYPILLSTMDGKPCPVQRALQIQAMPTMILVDRRGQVLWRDSGSTPAAENRLDRVLALSMSRGDTVRR